ncbi:hypothetical protein [Candidatus Lokiarchaeum ossiferum]|uniref:hypothetical protein n=1 Tax=Candidatus Lokiarchaeum ossiferum TaxID=2951803 RepID=UPI00352CE2B4
MTDRIILNYVRRELTNCEQGLIYIKGKTGISDAFHIYKSQIMQKIENQLAEISSI